MRPSCSLLLTLSFTLLPGCFQATSQDTGQEATCSPSAQPVRDDSGVTCFESEPQTVDGCLDTGVGCADIPTIAAPADDPDACWRFSNACIPIGWVSCSLDTGLVTCAGS